MSQMHPLKIATISDRCSGRARYASDLIEPGTAVAGIARSPHAHARVVHVNASNTLKVPGVLGVLTADDFLGVGLGFDVEDEPVLTSHVRYVGEGVAAVAAIDEQALLAGIAALDIAYEILPHALTIDDALALEVPLHEGFADNVVSDVSADPGDWDEANASVAHWVEGTFETAAVPHAYLEPRSCLVRESGNHLQLIAATHTPSLLAESYGEIAKTWGATVDIITPDIGGSFGAKWGHPCHLICLLFAHRVQCDMAMVMSHRDDMIAGRTRLAMRITMRIGATSDGKLLAKETEVWADNGAYTLHGPPVMVATTVRGDNLYKYAAIRAKGHLVYTNNIPSECFRGFGIPQSTFAQEQLVDELARKLGIDPFEMRRRNTVGADDTTVHGWEVNSCGFDECLNSVEQQMQAHRQQNSVRPDDRFKIGYGLSVCIHCVSNSGHDESSETSHVEISVDADGRVCVASGEVELGCGTSEVLLRTIEREIGIDRGMLRVVLGDTTAAPFGRGSFASRTSFFVAHAAIDASKNFTDKCVKLAADLGVSSNTPVPEIVRLAVEANKEGTLVASGQYSPKGVVAADEHGFGNFATAYTFGAHGCCVKVDAVTGKATVEEYWAAHDTGAVVYPIGATGQVIGGVVQGIGMALSETTTVGESGQMLNPNLLDDRVMTFADAPPIHVFFAPVFEDRGPIGAKSIGEPPIIPVAGCVSNAIYDAIGARQYKLPMSPEQVWSTLNRQETFQINAGSGKNETPEGGPV